MKSLILTFLLAMLVVATAISVRRAVTGAATLATQGPTLVAIGGSPVPPLPPQLAAIGGSPVPPLPPRLSH